MANDFGYLTLEDLKKAVIVDRLKVFEGNKEAAARSLGISKQTLYKLLEDYLHGDEEAAKKIKEATDQLLDIRDRQRSGYAFDPATGMSVPTPPQPMPGEDIPLLRKRD